MSNLLNQLRDLSSMTELLEACDWDEKKMTHLLNKVSKILRATTEPLTLDSLIHQKIRGATQKQLDIIVTALRLGAGEE